MILGQYILGLDEFVTAGIPDSILDVGGDPVMISPVQRPLRADTIMLDTAEVDSTQCLVRIALYADGFGPSDAAMTVRGVVYNAAGKLVAAGDAVTIVDAQAAGWVSLLFADAGLPLVAGTYQYGVHVGGVDEGANYYITDLTTGDLAIFNDEPFIAGPPATLDGDGSPTPPVPMMFLETIRPAPIPTNVTDDYLASLPFDIAERVFTAAGVIRSSVVSAVCGWYGNTFDATTGANAVVRSDGPLAAMVGERIFVTRRQPVRDRTVAVYVHDERDFPDELADQDVLLSERAFLALADPTMDGLDVTVGILG